MTPEGSIHGLSHAVAEATQQQQVHPIFDANTDFSKLCLRPEEKTIPNAAIPLIFPGGLAATPQSDRLESLPQVGSNFLHFHLLEQLGQGTFGRVYLAHDTQLSNRLIALKVTVHLDLEPQTLAQLQHTHIMPIYSVHQVGDLRAVCMPYFGACTLTDILTSLHRADSFPGSGKGLISTLWDRKSTLPQLEMRSSVGSVSQSDSAKSAQATNPNSRPNAEVTLKHLETLSFVDAVLWLGSRLADGLAHAHDRGILHRDLKPANILLTDEGQPMLLDFNLAESASNPSHARFGGTIPYMAPEHLAAFGGTPNVIVDHRSDIYSLGLILYEMLTRKYPFQVIKNSGTRSIPKMLEERRQAIPSLRIWNPSITPAVESIIQKCLDPNPARRYQSAADFREDLERQLAHQPLKYARETSVRERFQKWVHRHPRFASPATMFSAVAGFSLAIVPFVAQHRIEQKEKARVEQVSVARDLYQRFNNFADTAREHLTLTDPESATTGIESALKALNIYGILEDPNWLKSSTVSILAPEEQTRLEGDVAEISYWMIKTAQEPDLKQRFANALVLNLTTQPNLDGDKQSTVDLLRESLMGREPDPRYSDFEFRLSNSAVGRLQVMQTCELLRRGRFKEALRYADEAVKLAPNEFSSWLVKGRCHEASGEINSAIAAYSTCIALRPRFARGYSLRGTLFLTRVRDNHQAIADLDIAISLDANLLEARVNRALALTNLQRHNEGILELDELIENGKGTAQIYLMRAMARTKLGNTEGAAEDRRLAHLEQPTTSLAFLMRGVAKRYDSDYEGALQDFVSAESLNPRSIQALQNQAHILAERLNRNEDALQALDRYLAICPEDVHIQISRAVLLARIGKVEAALEQCDSALKARQLPADLYRAACVHALLSDDRPESLTLAIKYLALAMMRGEGYNYIETDTDLDPIRGNPKFKQLLNASRWIRSMAEFPMPTNSK
jgi:eukaryotic-like serine/threonine-protein kinase